MDSRELRSPPLPPPLIADLSIVELQLYSCRSGQGEGGNRSLSIDRMSLDPPYSESTSCHLPCVKHARAILWLGNGIQILRLARVTYTHRAQSGLMKRDREIRIFGYFSFFMHARIISERDFQTIHLKIIIPKKAFLGMMI